MTNFNQAFAKIERMRNEQLSRRQAIWQRIQDETPDIASFLTRISAVFGKPAAVKVEKNGEVLLARGVLLPYRDIWDGKMRRRK